jgi:dihydrofolate reductase
MKPVFIIVAVDEKGGIGKDGKIPWKDSADMKFFKATTTKVSNPNLVNACIMGRITYESVRLPGRKTILVGRGGYPDVESAVNACNDDDEIESIFICGGEGVYAEAMSPPMGKLIITRIPGDYQCDRFFTV